MNWDRTSSAMEVAERLRTEKPQEQIDQEWADAIEAERQNLLKRLSVDFLLDALSCAETHKLADMVTLYKSGDTMLLGLAVREIVDEYVEKCARVA